MSDEVAVLRIEGGKANAMTRELLEKIEKMVDDFEASDARAGVITGYDKYFSAGLALPALIDLDRSQMRDFIARFSRAMRRVYTCDKPIVAAINGHAIAGGCVLALMCDYRVMADNPDLKIGLNETQLGIGLPAIVMEPLRAQVSPRAIATIAIAGVLLAPNDAEGVGLVHRLAKPDGLMDVARGIARLLGSGGAQAIRQVKRGLQSPVVDALELVEVEETEAWLDTWFSEDAQKRLRDVLSKMKK